MFREHTYQQYPQNVVRTNARRHPATARHAQIARALTKIDPILDRNRRPPEQHQRAHRENMFVTNDA
jgi:hypothetical protein